MSDKYRVLPGIPADSRLYADRHTNTVFPITRFSSVEQVEKCREELIFDLRMAAGLYPWPEKTPLNVVRETAGRYDGFRVEKIMFETRPGFWSTGNLYLPEKTEGKDPAILNVIGHWERQRLTRQKEADYPQQLANFARMGFVCLTTDMIGKVDSRQISHEYGMGEKELWLSNGLGVQLWNNIRALDLLCSMPEVDPGQIGVTGASGGGSQTLFLSLVDDRIKAAAPINMISLIMQGGCACENAPGLRRSTNNGEMCAMLAPRPLFLAGSTGDWTKEQETSEYPQMLETYRLYGAGDKVRHYYQVAEHQYNAKTRKRVYSFFAKYLMDRDIEWDEQPIDIGDPDDLTWFRGVGRAPGICGDDEFFDAFINEREKAVSAMPRCEKLRMLGWMTGACGAEPVIADGMTEKDGGREIYKSVVVSDSGEQIPFAAVMPENNKDGRVCLMISGEGKSCLDSPEAKRLLSEGYTVMSGDIFLTGEYGSAAVDIAGGDTGKRYFTTFHYTDDAFRVRDIVLLCKAAKKFGDKLSLYALGGAEGLAACALPLIESPEKVCLGSAAPDSDPNIPGIMLLGGAKGCLELSGCVSETI